MGKKPRGHGPDSGAADPATGTMRDAAVRHVARKCRPNTQLAATYMTFDRGTRSRRRDHRPSAHGRDGRAGLVTLGLLYHMAAVLAGAMGVPPSSELERHIADLFTPYHDLLDQGYAYRYYAEPPPTPVITATLRFGEGRPDQMRPAAGAWACWSQDEAPATACPGQCPVRRFRGSQAAGR